MNVFLDDERKVRDVTWMELPAGPWVVVRNVNNFITFIEHYYKQFSRLPDFISFDHDLAEEHYPAHPLNWEDYQQGKIDYSKYQEKTGLTAAKFLVQFARERDLDLPRYAAHTMNVVGRKNITEELESYKQERNIKGN